MNDLVSVVIPIYKVEQFLVRCVRSVQEQSYRNLEIILVDDGSPDNCGKICDELAQGDERIKVYHKENGGLSDARNYGVERSHGQYITFIDSDDYVADDYIEYLYALLTENEADISVCPMTKAFGDTVVYKTREGMPVTQLLTGKEACYQLFGNLYSVLVTACGKLYKSEIVKQYPFPKGRVHEDEATTCKYYYASEKVAVGNRGLYAYYQNLEGITKGAPKTFKPDCAWALAHKAYFFEEQKETELAKLAWEFYFTVCVNAVLELGKQNDVYLKNFAEGKTLSKKLLLKYRLYRVSKTLYKMLLKLAGTSR